MRKLVRIAPKDYAPKKALFLVQLGKVIRTKICRTNTSLIELAS